MFKFSNDSFNFLFSSFKHSISFINFPIISFDIIFFFKVNSTNSFEININSKLFLFSLILIFFWSINKQINLIISLIVNLEDNDSKYEDNLKYS